MALNEMTSRTRHRAVDLIMTLYQSPAFALGTLLCGSAQNSRIPATSTLTVRQAEASHKRQLVQVDYPDLRDWIEEGGIEDLRLYQHRNTSAETISIKERRGRVAGDSEKEADDGLRSAQCRPRRSFDRSRTHSWRMKGNVKNERSAEDMQIGIKGPGNTNNSKA